jgi:hypothetical protein
LEPPLNHVPLLSKNTVLINLRVVKQGVDVSKRNDFLIKDLKVEIDHVYDIYPEPESMLLRVVSLLKSSIISIWAASLLASPGQLARAP